MKKPAPPTLPQSTPQEPSETGAHLISRAALEVELIKALASGNMDRTRLNELAERYRRAVFGSEGGELPPSDSV